MATKPSAKKARGGLLTRVFNAIKARFLWMYYYGRRAMWVSSTGVILLFLPMAFCYMSEVEKEMRKLGLNVAQACKHLFKTDAQGS